MGNPCAEQYMDPQLDAMHAWAIYVLLRRGVGAAASAMW